MLLSLKSIFVKYDDLCDPTEFCVSSTSDLRQFQKNFSLISEKMPYWDETDDWSVCFYSTVQCQLSNNYTLQQCALGKLHRESRICSNILACQPVRSRYFYTCFSSIERALQKTRQGATTKRLLTPFSCGSIEFQGHVFTLQSGMLFLEELFDSHYCKNRAANTIIDD